MRKVLGSKLTKGEPAITSGKGTRCELGVSMQCGNDKI